MHYQKGKGVIDTAGRKVCSKRQLDLNMARIHGANNDTASFTRLIIESRVSRALLNEAWHKGTAQRITTT
jgi:hypothetical protein